MNFKYNDGGRNKAGYKGNAGDCVVRAIAIVSGLSYKEVYDSLFNLNAEFIKTHPYTSSKKGVTKASPRDGNQKIIYHDYILSLGFVWIPTMFIGEGCTVHLKSDELPEGKLIVKCSKHLVAVIDGIINDTYDCSRNGTRCVYGYYIRK